MKKILFIFVPLFLFACTTVSNSENNDVDFVPVLVENYTTTITNDLYTPVPEICSEIRNSQFLTAGFFTFNGEVSDQEFWVRQSAFSEYNSGDHDTGVSFSRLNIDKDWFVQIPLQGIKDIGYAARIDDERIGVWGLADKGDTSSIFVSILNNQGQVFSVELFELGGVYTDLQLNRVAGDAQYIFAVTAADGTSVLSGKLAASGELFWSQAVADSGNAVEAVGIVENADFLYVLINNGPTGSFVSQLDFEGNITSRFDFDNVQLLDADSKSDNAIYLYGLKEQGLAEWFGTLDNDGSVDIELSIERDEVVELNNFEFYYGDMQDDFFVISEKIEKDGQLKPRIRMVSVTGELVHETEYDTDLSFGAFDSYPTANNGIVILGSSWAPHSSIGSLWMHFSSDSSRQKSANIQIGEYISASDSLLLADGGLLVLANSYVRDDDLLLIELDSKGEVVKENSLGEAGIDEVPLKMYRWNNSQTCLLVKKEIDGIDTVHVILLDNDGEVQLDKKIEADYVSSFFRDSNEKLMGIVFIDGVISVAYFDEDFTIREIRDFNIDEKYDMRSFDVDEENDLLVVSGFFENGDNKRDAWVALYNLQLEQLWLKHYGWIGNEMSGDINFTDNGIAFLAGTDVFGNTEPWLIDIDLNGLKRWSRSYASDSYSYPRILAVKNGYTLFVSSKDELNIVDKDLEIVHTMPLPDDVYVEDIDISDDMTVYLSGGFIDEQGQSNIYIASFSIGR